MLRAVDEKGRLFGVLNIIDGAIIGTVILIAVMLVRLYPIMGKTPIPVSARWIRVEVVTFTLPYVVDLIKVGDASYDEWDNPDARIVRVNPKTDLEYNRWYQYLTDKDKQNPYVVPVLIEIELLCTKNGDGERWYYRRQPILVSMYYGFDFQSDKYQFDCHVIRIKYETAK